VCTGLAILGAVFVVVAVTSISNYQKEQQFRALRCAKYVEKMTYSDDVYTSKVTGLFYGDAAKEPYNSAKEPYDSAKEPYIFVFVVVAVTSISKYQKKQRVRALRHAKYVKKKDM